MATILIADDSRFQVQLLSKALIANGFRVITAMDALQAWTMALRSAPDAIVLDINMPGGTGIEVLKKLRMSTKTQHIPVVVASGNDDRGIEQSTRELGASEFLHKPVDPDELCGILHRLAP